MLNARRHLAARIAGISCIAAVAAGTLGVASAEAAPMMNHHSASHASSHHQQHQQQQHHGKNSNSSNAGKNSPAKNAAMPKGGNTQGGTQ
ncbi:hypothetical protein ACWERI_37705, partial [Streptomyces collinus]